MKAQSAKRTQAPRRQNTRVNLSLGTEEYRRLFVTSVMTNESAGDIITRLIRDHLREFSLPARLTGRVNRNDRPDITDHSIDSAAAVAA